MVRFDSILGDLTGHRRSKWVRFSPQDLCDRDRIDTGLSPPCEFVAEAVNLTMMTSTKRHGKFIADLPP